MKNKVVRTIEFEKIPAIGFAIGTDHFDYSNGKKQRKFILILPFCAIKLCIVKRVFNTLKESV